MVLVGSVDPHQLDNGTVYVVRGADESRRISDSFPTEYIANGATAYLVIWEFLQDGQIVFHTDTTPISTFFGFGEGPQLTEEAEDIFGLALRMVYADTSDSDHHRTAQWRFSDLDNDDESEPYLFPSSTVSNAGEANDSEFRSALGGAESIQILIVDRTHGNIDWDNLQTVAAPQAPTAPSLTEDTDSITVTLSTDPTSDATIDTRDIQWRRRRRGAFGRGSSALRLRTRFRGWDAETEYEVQWRAVSTAGDGAWSLSETITTSAADLMPSLPAIFSQSATVGTAFSLTFLAATWRRSAPHLFGQWQSRLA